MLSPRNTPRRAWQRPVAILLLVLAACLPVGGRTPAQASPVHAQPTLLLLAARHPDAPLRVIVQRAGHDGSADRLVGRLGGRLTRDLSIINAFAATLPGRAVGALAAAPGVRWVSLDAPVNATANWICCNVANLQSVYPQAIGASAVWSQDQGQGIGVAVVDSGVSGLNDVLWALLHNAKVNFGTNNWIDYYGHGTHVAGIIAGNGSFSNGAYVGVAPQARILNVKVSDDQGMASTSDVVNGLQWVFDNAGAYNIRVVNLSLNSTAVDSYQVDPLDAAVETLWQAGIVVVASAGNTGSTAAGVLHAPANDPFAISVGAVDDHGSVNPANHTLAPFSSYGTIPISTTAGLTTTVGKPDLVAPGVNIVSTVASPTDVLALAHADHLLNSFYFRMSGTSMAAPMVSGAVALLLAAYPGLTPDQVKQRLMATASAVSGSVGVGAGEVNVAAALASGTTASANVGVAPAASLQPGDPASNWGSANWGSANWGSTDWSWANWGSANWGSANWGSANWGSANWGSVTWGSDYWGQ